MLHKGLTLLLLLAGAAAAEFSEYAATVLDKEPNLHLQQLAQFSDSGISLARTYLSPAHKKAAQQLKTWMQEAYMESWIDAMGNVHGRINGSSPDAPAVVLGSHYDTVLDGGKYDGALGIIVGIAAIKAVAIQAAIKAGVQLPGPSDKDASVPAAAVKEAMAHFQQPVHLVAFADEEGVRFQSTFLGSRALAGKLVQYGMLKAVDKQGVTMEQVIQDENKIEAGKVAEVLLQQAMPASAVQEYVEVHIEQGPILEGLGKPLGVVSAIAGQTRMWLTINGTQGHAGTVPMAGRQDSLAAAAAVVLAVEQACGGGEHPMPADAEQDMLVCTVGELQVWPGASNVIAGQTQLSIDIRAKSDDLRTRVVQQVGDTIEQLCNKRKVTCQLRRTHDAPAVLSDDGMMQGMIAAIRAAQSAAACEGSADSQTCPFLGADIEVPVLVSGAGHDAMAMAEITKMVMMFVRCRGGVSHSPLEHVEPTDVAAATAALAEYLKQRLLH